MLRFLDSFLLSTLRYRFLKCIIVLLSILSTQCAHSCNDNKKLILYLLERTGEPAYMPKGEKSVAFDVPVSYMPECYQPMAKEIKRRFANETKLMISVKPIKLPKNDLKDILELEREKPFSLFIPKHQNLAARLIHIFLYMKTFDDFLSVAVYCRDNVNRQLFIYAFSIAMMNRHDTKNITIPSNLYISPDKYIDRKELSKAKEQAYIVPDGSRRPIKISFERSNKSDIDDENLLKYWREDMGINLHHWHWHLVYPFQSWDRRMVDKDRRGELFYYMHHQILARYNCERQCNRLSRVKCLDLTKPIQVGYVPDLDSSIFGSWSPRRPGGCRLTDINRTDDNLTFRLQDIATWRDRITEMIYTCTYITTSNKTEKLKERNGIDIIGNIIEASMLSSNRRYYGNIHNFCHVAIAFCNDPNGSTSEPPGVMADSATAMRDPVFYQLHAFIDKLFKAYKDTLPPYSQHQLDFPGVQITDISVQTLSQLEKNQLSTFWTKSDVDLSRGLDFTPRGAVLIRFTHLNHREFIYRIVANNYNNAQLRGTVRIFIAPKQDERGLPYVFTDQKELMIEMDKFIVILKPGQNIIERNSTESSVTIPFEKTFRNLDENEPIDVDKLNEFNYDRCGWPHHMLVPKGTEEGFPMDLFIMISDYTDDEVKQDEPTGSRDAMSFCGLRDHKYPDARPMGYPFDRNPRPCVETLAQFLTCNMAVTQIIIRHMDTVLPRV